jgi:hypothetical protein
VTTTTNTLAEALRNVRACLGFENEKRNGPINDTIWYSGTETLFDYIDKTLAAYEAQAQAEAKPADESEAFEAWYRQDLIDSPVHQDPKKRAFRIWQASAAQAEANPAEPLAWLVLDEAGALVHAAAWRESAHEHINDAINEHGITEAARWVVRPAFVAAHAAPAPVPLTEKQAEELWNIWAKNHRSKPIDLIKAIEAAIATSKGEQA